MLTVFLVILGLALLIIGHEAGHFSAAKMFGMKIHEFGLGLPPKIKGWRRKGDETEYTINWLPLGGFVRIAGENGEFGLNQEDSENNIPSDPKERAKYFGFQPAWRRVIVLLAGIIVNLLLGWVLYTFVLMIGTSPAIIIQGVEPGSPAALAKIQEGDVILGFTHAEDFTNYTASHRGQAIQLDIERGQKKISFSITPRAKVESGHGAIGVSITEVGESPVSFPKAIVDGFKRTVVASEAVAFAFVDLFWRLLTHKPIQGDVAGPVGIVSMASKTGQLGWSYLLSILAIISINLAVLNFIPFPALDGGRVLMVLIEKIKGSPISARAQLIVNGVGFSALILLLVILTIRDVIRLI